LAVYTLATKFTVSATKLNTTSCQIQVDADLLPKRATKLNISARKSTIMATVDFVANLSPVSATVAPVCTGLKVKRGKDLALIL